MTLVKKFNLALVILSMIMAIVIGFSIPVFAQNSNDASAKDAVCESLGQASSAECGSSGGDIDNILRTVLNILSFVAGVIAVIMIIIAGVRFITSQGDSSSVAGARQTVIYAIVGVVIVLISQVIVRFVLTEATDLGASGNEESGLVTNIG